MQYTQPTNYANSLFARCVNMKTILVCHLPLATNRMASVAKLWHKNATKPFG